ncbi:hypothetical protein GCM10009087_49170 [Sphingomonas oligophenolica]
MVGPGIALPNDIVSALQLDQGLAPMERVSGAASYKGFDFRLEWDKEATPFHNMERKLPSCP